MAPPPGPYSGTSTLALVIFLTHHSVCYFVSLENARKSKVKITSILKLIYRSQYFHLIIFWVFSGGSCFCFLFGSRLRECEAKVSPGTFFCVESQQSDD
jgi:hypothetical protein